MKPEMGNGRPERSAPRGDTLSDAGYQLILNHEVGGGEAYYNARLRHPTWPGGESGVTIGIGYDLGYTPRARFLGDWHAMDDDDLARLAGVIGVRGLKARERVPGVRDVLVPWGLAFGVFRDQTIPFWIGQTRAAFPGYDGLPDGARAALVSLVFNRGPAMDGDRRREMRTIRGLVAQYGAAGSDGRGQILSKIAVQIRAMKRLWYGKGLDGLLRRRDDEAKMVESGDGRAETGEMR